MTSGEYEEDLPCGGKLKVTKNSWEIGYYFPGPDRRHNGTFITIPGECVEQYIIDFNTNWEEYIKLKNTIPKDGDFSKQGKSGMTIRIGRFNEGVCLRLYHMPINSIQHLNKVIESYHYAIRRAIQVQQLLASL